MDQVHEHQKLKALREFKRYLFLKKAFQFLLSVSIFSFIFSYSSSWLSFLIHSFNIYFHAIPFQFYTNPIDRKYMFLLCNGILVFLARNSGLIASNSPRNTDFHEDFFKENESDMQSVLTEVQDKTVLVKEEDQVPGESTGSLGNDVVVEEEKGEEKQVILITEDGDHGEEQEEEERSSISEEEERNRLLSTEELNKKFDDFIKKVKEEIRIEAQRQLVMV